MVCNIIFCVLIGSLFGYILVKIKNIENDLKLFDERQTEYWYDLCMKDGENSNSIKYLEEFLKMKYPDMDKEMMERFAHLNEQETKK